MDEYQRFKLDCAIEIAEAGRDSELRSASIDWITRTGNAKYTYHFEFLGRPIIQYPQDIVALQELVWSIKPDLIIENGIAHGGSLIFSASMLALLDLAEARPPRSGRRSTRTSRAAGCSASASAPTIAPPSILPVVLQHNHLDHDIEKSDY